MTFKLTLDNPNATREDVAAALWYVVCFEETGRRGLVRDMHGRSIGSWEMTGGAVSDTLYARLIAADVDIDHHASDLYFEKTPESMKILAQFPQVKAAELGVRLRADTEKCWMEAPSQYMPYWESRAAAAVRLANEAVAGAAAAAAGATV